MDQVSDKELVTRTVAGDRDAYRQLVERYQKRVYLLAFQTVGSREDAEDIAQETFVKAYLSLKDFKGESAFFTWLYRIAYNMAIDFRRKINRQGRTVPQLEDSRPESAVQGVGRISGSIAGPHEELMAKEERAKIQEVLATLSDEHRTAIVLREIDGLSYTDIAKVMGSSKGTVMSRLHYARKKLQRALGEFAPLRKASGVMQEDSQDSKESKFQNSCSLV